MGRAAGGVGRVGVGLGDSEGLGGCGAMRDGLGQGEEAPKRHGYKKQGCCGYGLRVSCPSVWELLRGLHC